MNLCDATSLERLMQVVARHRVYAGNVDRFPNADGTFLSTRGGMDMTSLFCWHTPSYRNIRANLCSGCGTCLCIVLQRGQLRLYR